MEVKESKAQVFHVFSTLVSEEPAKDSFRVKDTLTSSVLLEVLRFLGSRKAENPPRTALRNTSTCSTHRARPIAGLRSPRKALRERGQGRQLEQRVPAQLTQVVRLT